MLSPLGRLAAATLAPLVAVPLASAPAAADQSYPVPAGRVFTVHGHGSGHGHGLSQYGADGAARQGRTYRQILSFYYPGTRRAQLRSRIRVLVSADTTRDVVVSPARDLVVHDLGSGAAYPLPVMAGVRRWRLNVDGARAVVGYLRNGWHRYHPGGRAALAGDGQFGAAEPLTLWTPSGSRVYRGGLRAASPSPGSTTRDTVDVLSLDDYVRGVIPAEMPPSWSPAALQAQAVAARTYAAWSRAQAPDDTWHICDTSACQVYGGVESEDPRSDAAVVATARQVLTYDGAPAFTQFSASNGGWTAEGSQPYLVARADPYDDQPANPVHDWTSRLPAATIRAAYPAIGRLRRLVVTDRDGDGQWGGRVLTIRLDGARLDRTLSGATFRSRFGLPSTWFAP